jgi:hypothetical protein
VLRSNIDLGVLTSSPTVHRQVVGVSAFFVQLLSTQQILLY